MSEKDHKKSNPLRDFILGWQDGLVNALGIILGVMAATPDVKILIITVISASVAESISMGAVAYTSQLAQKDYYESERKIEEREVDTTPEEERGEIRAIYKAKGIKGEALESIVKTITSDKETWINVMMAEELKIQPVDNRQVLKSAVIVTISTAIGHMIPLFPFFFFTHSEGLIISIIFSGITLFGVGAFQAITLIGSWWKSGIRMLIIGLGAALLGFFVAKTIQRLG